MRARKTTKKALYDTMQPSKGAVYYSTQPSRGVLYECSQPSLGTLYGSTWPGRRAHSAQYKVLYDSTLAN